MGYNGFKDDPSYNPKYGINGRVQKDEFSIDGKSWNYRDPRNLTSSDADPDNADEERSQDAYEYTNPLYDYSYGQVRDAAKAKGITNVNNQKDVDSIMDFIQNGPEVDNSIDDRYATAEQLNSLQDSIQKRSEETGPTEISSTLTNAQREIGEYDEDKTSQGANIFGAMGPSNDLELAREEVQTNEASGDGQDRDNAEAYKDGYAFNVKGGLELSGIKTRGPESGINGEGF